MDQEQEASMEELMIAYVEGDHLAFDKLYAKLAPRLFAYLVRLCGERSSAEDLLQQTFIKIHRHREGYLRGAPVLPWTLAIAKRTFLDHIRKKKVRKEDLSNDGIMPEPPQTREAIDLNLSAALEAAMLGIPEQYREAIELTKLSGLSNNEAAELLDTTPNAIKLRVFRGFEAMRQLMGVRPKSS